MRPRYRGSHGPWPSAIPMADAAATLRSPTLLSFSYLSRHTSISFGRIPVTSSQTVIVEIVGDTLVPLGSSITVPGLKLGEEVGEVPLVVKALFVPVFALKLETDPMVFADPIG